MAYIGIDLGTTNSVAAIVNPKTRRVQVLSIEMEAANLPHLPLGERELIRSVVASQNGQYLRGWEALAYAKRDPRNTIFSVKRLMGRGYNDRKEYGAERNRGRLIRDLMCENWSIEIVNPKEATKDAVAVLLEGREHFPQEISKHILLEVKRVAEACGEKVEGAVITVPAYFNEKQCSATIEAALMAGITVQRILDEPTAAAKAYARDTLSLTPRTVLVYDLGGGTFDVSLLEIVGPNIRVNTIEGDNWLGGDDFDREIVNDLVDVIRIKTGKNPRNDIGLMFELRMRAERAKKELSDKQDTEIVIGDLFPGCSAVTLVREKEKLEDAIKRNPENTYIPRAYEEMISEYIEETIQLVDAVLERKGCEPDDVDKVLLVGGATKTPLVRKRLAEIFGEDKLETKKVDSMLAVAIGAAYASYDDFGIITCPWLLEDGKPCLTENRVGTRTCINIKCGKPLPVTEKGSITERPYGIETRDSQKKRNVFDVIIPKDERYPMETPAKRIFYVGESGTRMLKVRFFAGEKCEGEDFHDDIEKNKYQGTVWMVLPPETP
ncbi:MAG: Hsp70 family protein, partial [Candidatus Aminicenantes bacterium]|nr:Hsp70 family protein [Candidatus Aminicenantes bacterium]